MHIDPPVKLTRDEITFKASEIEPFLRGPAMDIPPFPNATCVLPDGREMFIRAMRIDEVPLLLPYMKKIMEVEHDFYDIVGVRCYAELLGWYRHRLKDPYFIVGIIDGQIAGFANGRLMNEDINISHHTMTFQRRGNIGTVMYYCKAYYTFEVLQQEEFWSTFESYNGWRLGFQTVQTALPWPEYQHELGGARVFPMTSEHWHKLIKDYLGNMIRTQLVFDNITKEKIKANEHFTVPEEIVV